MTAQSVSDALLGIAIIGGGSWGLMPLGISVVCAIIASFTSWILLERETSERTSALIKSRRVLAILLEGGFWVAMTGRLMLATLGQSRTAAYNVLLVVSLIPGPVRCA